MEPVQTFTIHWGLHALLKLVRDYSFESVLDIGTGAGEHARFLRLFGKRVKTCNLFPPADWAGDFLEAPIDESFDVIWCSHVLEHQRNPGQFLDKIYRLLRPGGHLALCLPIHPPERLVPGHFSIWSPALACQHLIHAGFDCTKISLLCTYELAIVVQKRVEDLRPSPTVLPWDAVKDFFPEPLCYGSEIRELILNWGDLSLYPLKRPQRVSKIEILSKNLDLYPLLRPTLQWKKRENRRAKS